MDMTTTPSERPEKYGRLRELLVGFFLYHASLLSAGAVRDEPSLGLEQVRTFGPRVPEFLRLDSSSSVMVLADLVHVDQTPRASGLDALDRWQSGSRYRGSRRTDLREPVMSQL
eukprot:scaffold2782_cov182-Amphora_coffeaeformis.AAC.38